MTTFTTGSKTYDHHDGVSSKPFSDGVEPQDHEGGQDLDRDNDRIAGEKR